MLIIYNKNKKISYGGKELSFMKKYLRFLIIAAVMFLVGVFVSLGASAARSGELKPSSDRVIFIKDYQKDDTAGDGSGKDDDNPLRLVSH